MEREIEHCRCGHRPAASRPHLFQKEETSPAVNVGIEHQLNHAQEPPLLRVFFSSMAGSGPMESTSALKLGEVATASAPEREITGYSSRAMSKGTEIFLTGVSGLSLQSPSLG